MQVPDTIWTVGHSTRPFEEFVHLLQHYGVQAIADVRRHPGSRRLPQFGADALAAALPERGIDYVWVPELGGRRRAAPDTTNTGWRNASFRGYADHMGSVEFATGLTKLITLATARRTAMMCAELLWWRCHRSLVSDLLKFYGCEVRHIQDERQLSLHPYTAPARQLDGSLGYSAIEGEPLAEPKKKSAQLRLEL